MKRGFSEEDAKKAIDILASNQEFFIDHMMVQELGLMPPDPEDNPAKDGSCICFDFFSFWGFDARNKPICLCSFLLCLCWWYCGCDQCAWIPKGFVTFLSFIAFGFVCLFSYLVVPHSSSQVAFGVSIGLTGFTLLLLGVVKVGEPTPALACCCCCCCFVVVVCCCW